MHLGSMGPRAGQWLGLEGLFSSCGAPEQPLVCTPVTRRGISPQFCPWGCSPLLTVLQAALCALRAQLLSLACSEFQLLTDLWLHPVPGAERTLDPSCWKEPASWAWRPSMSRLPIAPLLLSSPRFLPPLLPSQAWCLPSRVSPPPSQALTLGSPHGSGPCPLARFSLPSVHPGCSVL